ncbi:MAG: hypothetical protein ACI93R_003131 [Flavobacteriales bacterium]|jgi:hypothetical protein
MEKSMNKIKIAVKLFFFAMVTLLFPSSLIAKPMPSDLTELIINSDLIAIVDVFEIESRGKSFPGSASATISKIIQGQSKNPEIKMYWEGSSIYGLGKWVVFLKRKENGYYATYGARSFWKVDQAKIEYIECCSPFVVLQPPVNSLNIDPSLTSMSRVYIDGVPREYNPIRAKGIEIDKLINYIENLTKKDK